MTDTLDSDPTADYSEVPDGRMKQCGQIGCEQLFSTDGPGGHFRKYCDEHQPPKKSKAKGKRPKRDTAPPSINFNIGPKAKGKDPALQAVEDRAKELVQLAAAITLIAGLQADALDLQRGSDAWAKTVRDLAEYEDWLKKLASGGETTGRAMAWVQFALATVALLMPILMRHEALPAGISKMASQAFAVAEATAEAVPDVPAAA